MTDTRRTCDSSAARCLRDTTGRKHREQFQVDLLTNSWQWQELLARVLQVNVSIQNKPSRESSTKIAQPHNSTTCS